MTLVIIHEETLKKLWLFQVQKGLKSHDEAVRDLLERADHEPKKTKV